jgi:uridine kinase
MATDAERLLPLLRGRVGIDGPDAAGKTTLAAALAALTGLPRVSADDFLAPAEVRHAHPGPDGYYAHAFDLAALRAEVERHDACLADGVFLFRPELDDLWDTRVFVDVGEAEQTRRVLARDGDVLDRYAARYRPAYAAYRAAHRPDERADVVLG